jgi:redox-sensitive bicupin YhaK (pirin superfamily)
MEHQMNSVSLSHAEPGAPHGIGDHFFAHNFNRRNAGEEMNPLLMVDHFWMKRDTFGWHPHRAISAVTYVFEDSKSTHQNYDATGNNLPIRPGSLHWMVAGSGTTHCERPEEQDALVHGLQFFVDLPEHLKDVSPYAVHLDGQDIPVVTKENARLRVVAGEYDGVRSPAELPQPFALYDVFLEAGGQIEVPLPANWGGSFLSVSGDARLAATDRRENLPPNQAIGVRGGEEASVVTLSAEQAAHVVVLAGAIVPSN